MKLPKVKFDGTLVRGHYIEVVDANGYTYTVATPENEHATWEVIADRWNSAMCRRSAIMSAYAAVRDEYDPTPPTIEEWMEEFCSERPALPDEVERAFARLRAEVEADVAEIRRIAEKTIEEDPKAYKIIEP